MQQLVQYHKVNIKGGAVSFWHRTFDGRNVHRIYVHERVQTDLELGRCGVVVSGDLSPEADPQHQHYHILPKPIVERIIQSDPSRVVFFAPIVSEEDDTVGS